jgi:hypothetical protein
MTGSFSSVHKCCFLEIILNPDRGLARSGIEQHNGRFHVRTNKSGQQILTDSEDEPVKNVAHLGKMGSGPLPEAPDLSAADFKAAVKNKLQWQQ